MTLRPVTEVLKLHDVERSSVDADITLFLKTQLTEVAETRSNCSFGDIWPTLYDVDALCKKLAGLFIYASTVVKFIALPHHLPTERLTLIILSRQSTTLEGRSETGSAPEYACRYWTKHLSKIRSNGPRVVEVKAAIEKSFTTHLLFWIEVLSLTGWLNISVYAIRDIDERHLSVSRVGYLL